MGFVRNSRESLLYEPPPTAGKIPLRKRDVFWRRKLGRGYFESRSLGEKQVCSSVVTISQG